jgi:hypothetical protein
MPDICKISTDKTTQYIDKQLFKSDKQMLKNCYFLTIFKCKNVSI